jgi:hypothetical protein
MVKRFPDPEQCLASCLALWGAEVLRSSKPANLISVNNRRLPCGRNLYHLWLDQGDRALANSPLRTKVLFENPQYISLLIYRPELLQRRLSSRTMGAFLKQYGYPQPMSLDSALTHLKDSWKDNVPDEIGMFLGYPFKDVKGFIHKTSQPWNGRCLWRIYGPTSRSIRLYNHYRQAREEIATKLAASTDPLKILMAA